MPDRAIDVYLNDHLAGATLGVDLARQIRDRHDGEELGGVMESLVDEIEQDRQTLLDLMERLGVSENPVKQATGWLAEKASRVKFSGVLSGEPDHGAFMAIESLTLGVEGKASMWKALKEVAEHYPSLATTSLDDLIERAEAQKTTLERERLSAVKRALRNEDGSAAIAPEGVAD
ncbi:MAG TPA: hypothetical protein VIJ20_02865 [Solirubrobacteraceae bacterium]